MRVLVCGDRNWTNRNILNDRLLLLDHGTTIISGAARGADSMAADFARQYGYPLIEIPADWTTYGKAAGPIRNRQMLDLNPDIVIAFHNDITSSKGTKDTVTEAKRRGIPRVEIISED